MKRRFITVAVVASFLVTLGVFSVGGAPAFQATVTPTSTITAQAGYIPTINPTQNLGLDCNQGTPIGWGTVTPDAAWSVLCSHCMSTAIPSSTVAPSITPTLGIGTPSVTPSPTVTPTVTPAGFCNAVSLGAVTVEYNVFGYPTDGAVSYFLNCSTNTNNSITCDGNITATDTTDFSGIDQEVLVKIAFSGFEGVAYWTMDDHTDRTDLGAGVDDIMTPGFRGTACGPGFFANAPRSGACTVTGSSPHYIEWRAVIGGAAGSDVITSANWHAVISFGNNCTTGGITATPSPTSAAGYCQIVNGGGVVPDSGFEWNGILFGSTACFDIGPIPTWDFGFLVININIPWIAHLCLTNIDLGVITAFGVQISLLTVSYVWGIAWAIRNLFTS